MALPPKEIRYSRRAFIPVIVFCIFWAICMTGGNYFFHPMKPMILPHFIYMTGLLGLGFLMGWLSRMRWDNLPVLTFHSQGLEIHRRKPVFIQWSAVTKWKIRNTKNGKVLDIRTNTISRSIALGSLELPARVIEELVATYIRQPGPGGFQR